MANELPPTQEPLDQYEPFLKQCNILGINPDEPYGYVYWDTVADFFEQGADQKYTATMQPDTAALWRLFMVAPSAVNDKASLEFRGKSLNPDQRLKCTQRAAHFNRCVCDAARCIPGLSASALTGLLTESSQLGLGGELSLPAASTMVSRSVKGMQHEVTFGQILGHTGHTFRIASELEDVAGLDYVVTRVGKEPLRIGVTAKTLRPKPGDVMGSTPEGCHYRIRTDGIVEIASLIKNDDIFQDRFFVDSNIAANRAANLSLLLNIL
jgi:hypothetical protein